MSEWGGADLIPKDGPGDKSWAGESGELASVPSTDTDSLGNFGIVTLSL